MTVRTHRTSAEIATLIDLPFDKLVTATNAGDDKDTARLAKLGLVPMEAEQPLPACKVLEATA